jgi:hypothetical protein
MLNLIRDTENDDVSNVIQRLIYVYEEEITTYAVEIMKHLADTFLSIVKFCEESDENDAKDDKTIAAVGILSTVESILHSMEGKLEVMGELEKLTLPIIYAIIQNGMMDFYEELFTLISDLTSKQVSDNMWNVLYLLYDIFQNDAADYFVEMMPVLHNYITVDTPGFLADPKRLEVIFKMCQLVLTADTEDDEAESHAAKLLEIIVLQCHSKIDQVLPTFIQLILQRMSKEILGTELRTMCIQVIVAALWCSTETVLNILDQISIQQNTGRSFLLDFLQKWFADLDCYFGLHDRKICVLGLCTLLQIATKRPHDVAQVTDKLLPSAVLLLEGLEKVYALREKDDSEDEFEETDGEFEETVSDEEDEDEKKSSRKSGGGGTSAMESEKDDTKAEDEDDEEDSDLEDFDDDDDEYDRTLLENYETCIDENDEVDEFVIFKDTLLGKYFILKYR